jgi:5-formyltetrahydrofolate cyclo-ligase
MTQEQKRELRAVATRRRQEQVDKDRASRHIVVALTNLPEFRRAELPVLYVDVRHEVRTQPLIAELLDAGQSVVVPFCQGDDLRLCRVDAMPQLAIGAYGILEPATALQTDATQLVDPASVDLIVIPGVAFDQRGYRLGHGFGYYDRLLTRVSERATLVALAYECQMFDKVPHEPHDVAVDIIVTESAVYRV